MMPEGSPFLRTYRCFNLYVVLLSVLSHHGESLGIYFTSVPLQITRSNTASFSFACGEEAGGELTPCPQVQYSQDSADFIDADPELEHLTLSALADGPHTLTVRLDLAPGLSGGGGACGGGGGGGAPDPGCPPGAAAANGTAAYAWAVDTVAPETAVLAWPGAPPPPGAGEGGGGALGARLAAGAPPGEPGNATVVLGCSEEPCRFYYVQDLEAYAVAELKGDPFLAGGGRGGVNGQVELAQGAAGAAVAARARLRAMPALGGGGGEGGGGGGVRAPFRLEIGRAAAAAGDGTTSVVLLNEPLSVTGEGADRTFELSHNMTAAQAIEKGWPPLIQDPFYLNVYGTEMVEAPSSCDSAATAAGACPGGGGGEAGGGADAAAQEVLLYHGVVQEPATTRRWLVLPSPPGAHRVSVTASDGAGNVDPAPAAAAWVTAAAAAGGGGAPPRAVLDSAPWRPRAPGGDARFRAHCRAVNGSVLRGADVRFEYRLAAEAEAEADTAAAATAEVGVAGPGLDLQLTNLTDGAHTLTLRCCVAAGGGACPAAGEEGEGAGAGATRFTWEVAAGPPAVAIEAGPPALAHSYRPAFRFATDARRPAGPAPEAAPGGAEGAFLCRVDGGPWAGCAAGGPAGLEVADGAHALRVRAVDAAGRVSAEAAAWAWEVSGLDTVLAGCPEGPGAAHALHAGGPVGVQVLRGDAPCGGGAGAGGEGQGEAEGEGEGEGWVCSFRYRLDGGEWAAAAAGAAGVALPADLSAGRHTLAVQGVATRPGAGEAEVVDKTPALCAWTVLAAGVAGAGAGGTTALTIASGPPPISSAAGANFTLALAGASANETVEYYLDGPHHYPSAWRPLPPAPPAEAAAAALPAGAAAYLLSLEGLEDGAYLLLACAAASGACVSRGWQVDGTPPAPRLAAAPRPQATSHSPAADFEVLEDCRTCALEYALVALPAAADGGEGGGGGGEAAAAGEGEGEEEGVAWLPAAAGPLGLAVAAAGRYALRLRSTTADGRRAAEARFEWAVDFDHPETRLVSAPAAAIRDLHATFAFECEVAGAPPPAHRRCTYEYQLRAAAPAPAAPGGGGAGAAAWAAAGPWYPSQSALALYQLHEGAYELQVRAVYPGPGAAAGGGEAKDLAPAVAAFTVDVTPPQVAVAAPPPPTVHAAALAVGLACDEPGCAFWARVTGPGAGGAGGGAWEPVAASPHALAGLTDGEWAVEYRAVDPAGNEGPAAGPFAFRVDLGSLGARLLAAPAAATPARAARFTLAADAPGQRYRYRLDGGPLRYADAPAAAANATGPGALGAELAFEGLAEGPHALRVWAAAAGGAWEPEGEGAAWEWTVDTLAPQTTLVASEPSRTTHRSVVLSASAAPAAASGGGEGGGEEGAAAPLSPPAGGYVWAHYAWVAGAWTTAHTPAAAGGGAAWRLTGLAEGPHSVAVAAVDAAGNAEQSPAGFYWVVDSSNADGVPGPVASLAAAPGNGVARVSWLPPLDDGGFAVQQYEVLAYTKYTQIRVVKKRVVKGAPDPATGAPGPAPTFLDFPGLVNGDTYCFKVRAENQKGKGPLSACSGDVAPYRAEDPCGLVTCSGGRGACFPRAAAEGGDGKLAGRCVCRPGYAGAACERETAAGALAHAPMGDRWGECAVPCYTPDLHYEQTLVYGEGAGEDEVFGLGGGEGGGAGAGAGGGQQSASVRERTVQCMEFWGGVTTGRAAAAEQCPGLAEEGGGSTAEGVCGNHSCMLNRLKVNMNVHLFYDDINFNLESRDAFSESFSTEVAYALHIQTSRVADFDFWKKDGNTVSVEFYVIAGDDPNELPVDLLALQLQLQAEWPESELMAHGTFTPKIDPSSIDIEEILGTTLEIVRAKNFAYDLMIILIFTGFLFAVAGCYGFCIQKTHGRWAGQSKEDEAWWDEYFSGEPTLPEVDMVLKPPASPSKTQQQGLGLHRRAAAAAGRRRHGAPSHSSPEHPRGGSSSSSASSSLEGYYEEEEEEADGRGGGGSGGGGGVRGDRGSSSPPAGSRSPSRGRGARGAGEEEGGEGGEGRGRGGGGGGRAPARSYGPAHLHFV